MQVTIQGHSMNVSQRLDKYVRNKTEKLDVTCPVWKKCVWSLRAKAPRQMLPKKWS